MENIPSNKGDQLSLNKNLKDTREAESIRGPYEEVDFLIKSLIAKLKDYKKVKWEEKHGEFYHDYSKEEEEEHKRRVEFIESTKKLREKANILKNQCEENFLSACELVVELINKGNQFGVVWSYYTRLKSLIYETISDISDKTGYGDRKKEEPLSSVETLEAVAKLEVELERLEVVPPTEENIETLIEKAKLLISNTNSGGLGTAVHATEAEMLPWLYNRVVYFHGDNTVNVPRHFADKEKFQYWLFWTRERLSRFKTRLKQRPEIVEMLKEMFQKYGKKLVNMGYEYKQLVYSVDVSTEPEKSKFYEIVGKLSPEESDEVMQYLHLILDIKEYFILMSGDFLPNDEKVNTILAQALSKTRDMGKTGSLRGHHHSADVMVWLQSRLIIPTPDETYFDRLTHPMFAKRATEFMGNKLIKGITCVTDYSLEKTLNFLKLQFGESYDQYPPVFDIDGNLIWPRQISYEELTTVSENI